MPYLIALILALIPLYIIRFNIVGFPTTLLEISIYVVFLIGITKGYSQGLLFLKELKKKVLAGDIYILSFVAFILFGLASVFISSNLTSSLGAFKAWYVDGLMVFLLILCFTKVKKDISTLVSGLSVGALLVSLIGIGQYVTGQVLSDGRIPSLYIYDNVLIPSGGLANFVALYIVPIILLQVGMLVGYVGAPRDVWKIGRFILSLSVAVELFALFLTRSYGGVLGLVVGLGILGTYKFFQARFRKDVFFPLGSKKIFFILFVGLVFIIFVFSQINTSKFQKALDVSGATSTNARFQIWRASWLILKDYPVSGVGLNNFQEVYAKYIPKVVFPPLEWLVPHAHNLYLSLWLETGFLGLLMFLILIGKTIRYFVQRPTLWSIALLASLASILVHGLVDTPILKNDLAIVFWALMALGVTHKEVK